MFEAIAGWIILSIAAVGCNYCCGTVSHPDGESRWARIGARLLDRTS